MGLFSKVHSGLSKTRENMFRNLRGAFGKGKLTEDTLENLEELLIGADISFEIVEEIVGSVRKRCLGMFLSNAELMSFMAEETKKFILEPKEIPQDNKPHVILIMGVNGVGKTTSIAKLANFYKSKGKKVLLAAGDTFRAGAIEQLDVWSQRVGVDIVKHQEKSDAAAVIYDAYEAAKSRGHDIILVDTAGRLHNKDHLMEEMKKIIRVLKKHDEALPHEVLMVLDGNVGQNAIPQAKAFNAVQALDGFIITKLDGTAKGGALISTNWELKIPVKWIGVGEGINDLIPFSPLEYAKGLFEDEEVDIPLEQQKVEGKFRGLEI